MISKTTLIGIFALFVIFGIAGYLIVNRQMSDSETPAPTQTTNSFPISNTSQNTPGSTETRTLRSSTGQNLIVNDFMKNQDVVVDRENIGYYYLGNHFIGEEIQGTPPYVIQYVQETQFFNIGLYKEPIGQSRLQAEAYLLRTLGLSKEQLCTLKYMVSVPNFVNEFYSGTSLGFSFCKGSVPL